MQEIQVPSLGEEDPLEKEMATYSSIFAWEIHGQRSLEGCTPWGCKESDMNEQLINNSKHHTQWVISYIMQKYFLNLSNLVYVYIVY